MVTLIILGPTIGCGVFETDSGFRVEYALRGRFNRYFWVFFAAINKILVFAGGLGTGL